jgi:hypothetical protein
MQSGNPALEHVLSEASVAFLPGKKVSQFRAIRLDEKRKSLESFGSSGFGESRDSSWILY